MAVTRIKNNQITDAITGNLIVGINANTKVQPYSITSNLLANNFTYGSDFTITGNLSVTGTTTAVDTTYTNIQDPLIVLADGQTSGAPALDIGYIGLRGNQSNIAFIWKEANAEFSTTYTTAGLDTSNTTITIDSYANLKSNNINAVSDVSAGGNVLATTNVSAGANVFATTDVSAGGNVTGGNVFATTAISTSGNVTGGNVLATTDISAGGNIIGNSLIISGGGGNISSAGNIYANNITATGNIGAGSYLFGDGYFISNINGGNVSATRIYNGTSNVDIPTADGNVIVTVDGNLVTTFYNNGVNFNNDVSAGGNITGTNVTGGNVFATTNVSAGANVTGGNVLATTDVSAGANVFATTVSASGNVIGGNLVTSGAGGNIVGAGWVLAGNVSTVGDVIAGGNVAAGNITATGNIFTDFAVRGGTVSSFGNVNVGGNIIATGNVSTQGRVYAVAVSASGNIRANGSLFVNDNITSNANIYADNVSLVGNTFGYNMSAFGNVYGDNVFATTVSATGNITGGNLNSNFLNSTSSTLQISAAGNLAGISLLTNGGNIGAGSNWINNVVDPVQPQDAATKYYVDSVAQGLSIKTAVVVSQSTYLANTAGVSNVVYNQPNGVGNGIGATLTISTANYLTLDGIDLTTLEPNARVLINRETGAGANDTNAAWNGIYTLTSTVQLETVLTRATDNDTAAKMYDSFTYVAEGTDWASTGWVCTDSATLDPIIMGTTAIHWTQFSGAANYTQGNGIQILGQVISTRVNTGNLEYDGSGNLQVSSTATFTTPNIGSATGTQISVTGDVSGNNAYVTTDVSAGGNVIGGNVLATTNVSAGGNVNGGNVLATTNVSAGGNITTPNTVAGGTVEATNNVSAGGDVVGGNVRATTYVSAGGNIIGGNVFATTDVSAGGNLFATTDVSVGSNVIGNNISATTNISAGGNVYGNVGSFANVTATGNIVAGNYLKGDGYYISNINGANVSTTKIANGTSNVAIATANGNVTVAVNSNLVATFYDTGLNLQGNISTVANVLVGTHAKIFGSSDGPNVYYSTNFVDDGSGLLIAANSGNGIVISNDDQNKLQVSSTFAGLETNSVAGGNAQYTLRLDQGGNLTLGGTVGGGTFNASAISSSGSVVGGNITGGNVFVTVAVSAGGNVTGGNVYTGGAVSAGGDVTGANISTGGLATVAGNIQAAGTFLVDTTDNTVLMGNVTNLVADSVLTLNAKTSMVVPVGATGDRPLTPYTGMLRFNTSTNQMEVYNNSEWASVGQTNYTVISDEQFAGDGSTVQFTLGSSQTTSSCIVSINGVVQIPTLAYAVSGIYPTCYLIFTEAPAVGDVIDVRQLTTTTTVTYISNTSGNAEVSASYNSAQVNVTGNLVATLSSSAPSLTANSTVSFQLVNNTTLAFIVRGTDGTTRTATVSLS
jgi:hypothetical protein